MLTIINEMPNRHEETKSASSVCFSFVLNWVFQVDIFLFPFACNLFVIDKKPKTETLIGKIGEDL